MSVARIGFSAISLALGSRLKSSAPRSRRANIRADFLSVLDAHTQVLDTERELVQAQTDAAISAVSLYRALGGGWRSTP